MKKLHNKSLKETPHYPHVALSGVGTAPYPLSAIISKIELLSSAKIFFAEKISENILYWLAHPGKVLWGEHTFYKKISCSEDC